MILDVHITCVLIISHSFKTLRTENNKKHDFAYVNFNVVKCNLS